MDRLRPGDPIVKLSALASGVPEGLQIVLADLGSAGGLHRRWSPLRKHVTAVLFDPLDPSSGSGRDRYFPVAVAQSKGQARLHVTKFAPMSSTLLPNAALLGRFWKKPCDATIVSTLEVPTDSLDDVMQANGIALDVIKVDVQGAEYQILSGARSVIANSLFLAEIEVSFIERYVGLHTAADVISRMREWNFDLIDLSRPKRYCYRNSLGVVNPSLGNGDWAGRLAYCDALFMLNDDALLARVASDHPRGGPELALKSILALLAYGKADLAAWILDATAERLPAGVRDAITRFLKSKRSHRLERFGLHRHLDRLARRM